MPHIVTRKAVPTELDEVWRDFKPLTVSEKDATIGPKLCEDGLFRVLQRRGVEVVFVDPEDANRIRRIWFDKGPATGEDALTIPCEEAVDMAQVQDIFLAHKERLRQHMAERAARQPDRDKRFYEGLVKEADLQEKRKLGLSTIGPGGMTQRSTP